MIAANANTVGEMIRASFAKDPSSLIEWARIAPTHAQRWIAFGLLASIGHDGVPSPREIALATLEDQMAMLATFAALHGAKS